MLQIGLAEDLFDLAGAETVEAQVDGPQVLDGEVLGVLEFEGVNEAGEDFEADGVVGEA